MFYGEVVVCRDFEIHADMKTCEVFAPAWGAPLEVPWETILCGILDISV